MTDTAVNGGPGRANADGPWTNYGRGKSAPWDRYPKQSTGGTWRDDPIIQPAPADPAAGASITEEQYKEAARKAYAAGDVETARSLISRAQAISPTAAPLAKKPWESDPIVEEPARKGWRSAPIVEQPAQKVRDAPIVEAELFDGTILEFPEGTSPDVIKRVAKEQTALRRSPAPPSIRSRPPTPNTRTS